MYGMYIKPDHGSSFLLDSEKNQPIGFLSRIDMPYSLREGWKSTPHNIKDIGKYNIIFIPRIMSRTFKTQGAYDWGSCNITNYKIEGNNFLYYGDNGSDPIWKDPEDDAWSSDEPYFRMDIYGYLKERPKYDYGIQLRGMNNIYNLNSELRGYCIYAELVSVTGGKESGWFPPKEFFLNENNPMLFARPEKDGVTFCYNKMRGLTVSETCKVYVVIFNTNLRLQAPKSGVVIYNEKKEITYTSRYKPLHLGQSTWFDRNNGGTFEQLKKPMILPDSHFVNWVVNRGYMDYYRTGYYFMSNNKVGMRDIYYLGGEYGGPYGPSGSNGYKTNYDLYGIELSDYFNI
ncbi:TPA: hypothetical protein SMP78_003232 [Proteus mirabilis]